MTVSALPNVPSVYLRDASHSNTRSTCSCDASVSGTDWNGTSFCSGGASSGPGYQVIAHFLSSADSEPGGWTPSWKSVGCTISPGGKSYSMIESGSHSESSTSVRLSLRSTLLN